MFGTIDIRASLVVAIALAIAGAIYIAIPYDASRVAIFLPEKISLYNIADSQPQKVAYYSFLLTLTLGSALLALMPLSPMLDGRATAANMRTLLVISIVAGLIFSYQTAGLGPLASQILVATTVLAVAAYIPGVRWVAFGVAAIFILAAMLPGLLHTPTPNVASLTGYDQHYDPVMYQGRQLAAGHYLFKDMPARYSYLWTTLIGMWAKFYAPPTFGSLVRLVQAGQVLCLSAFIVAGWIRVQNCRSGQAALAVLLAVGAATWLSTDGFAIWLPNQSGFRFLMMPAAVCLACVSQRMSPLAAAIVIGASSAFAIIHNLETGIAVTAGLGMAYLLRARSSRLGPFVASTLAGLMAFCCVFLSLGVIYRTAFGLWPLPSNAGEALSLLAALRDGYGGLPLECRPLPILLMAHAGYVLAQAVRALVNRNNPSPDPLSVVIATMILVWLPYYAVRPDDWNLWTFIALYLLLIAPSLNSVRPPVLTLAVALFLALPIAVRNVPYFVIDPIRQGLWMRGYEPACASGLKLPEDHCAHLRLRAETLRDWASRGSIVWSTAIPVLTSQMSGLGGQTYWTGDLFALSRTPEQFAELIGKALTNKIDVILLDDPQDPFVKPRPPEIAFAQRLMAALRSDYCDPEKIGGWMVARRSNACPRPQ